MQIMKGQTIAVLRKQWSKFFTQHFIQIRQAHTRQRTNIEM